MSPSVTILLPVYNGEKTIKATLQSLLNQTFSNFELIIGIDGTTDKSKDIALSLGDTRIKIIEHPNNLGLANNLNEIIKHASEYSKYFAMAEQDDVYVTERLAWQVEVMEKYDDIDLVSGIAEFQGDGGSVFFPGILKENKAFPLGIEMFKYLYINQLKVVNTCMLWKKDIHLNKNLKFKNTYGNFNIDWDFILRFSLKHKIFGMPKVLVKMNRRSTHQSVTSDKKEQHVASRKLLLDFKKEFPDIISPSMYSKALKNHRKIELGHNNKFNLTILSILYFIRYLDPYFLKYYYKRLVRLVSN